MSAGKLGSALQPRDMAYLPGRDYPIAGKEGEPDFGKTDGQDGLPIGGLLTPIFDQIGGRVSDAMFGPRQDNQQYYQQMRKSIDGMNEAFSQIEKMQMPGGQYQGGRSGGGGKGKGESNF